MPPFLPKFPCILIRSPLVVQSSEVRLRRGADRDNPTPQAVVDADILAVYDYVSTPDFRTEWHMGSVEVSGPAIDHSAVIGEQFVEEMRIGDVDTEARLLPHAPSPILLVGSSSAPGITLLQRTSHLLPLLAHLSSPPRLPQVE